MAEEFSWRMGMSVDLITAPGDIRKTSIQTVEEKRITLFQTVPPLDSALRNRTILMTFSDGLKSARSGCKAKVTDIGFRGDGTQGAFIVVEKGEAIAAYDLRKYPRFNPGLFDDVRILYDESALEVTDISAGGVRGLCRTADLDHLTRGGRHPPQRRYRKAESSCGGAGHAHQSCHCQGRTLGIGGRIHAVGPAPGRCPREVDKSLSHHSFT